MRLFAILFVLLTGCQVSPSAPAPSTPPPPEPQRPANVAWVRGVVADASGLAVESPSVRAWVGDDRCVETGGAFDAEFAGGEFVVRLESGVGPVHERCVVVEASFGGTAGRTTTRVAFGSSSPPLPEQTAHVRVQLEPGPPLTRAISDRLVAQLARGIADRTDPGIAAVSEHVWGRESAVSPALDAYRRTLGTPVNWEVATEDRGAGGTLRRIDYRLSGPTGRSGIVGVEGGAVIRVYAPPLHYAARADAFVARFLELVLRDDAPLLARLLTADDIDYPVENAQRIIAAWRAEFDQLRDARPELVAFDEPRSTILYRATGMRNGAPHAKDLALGYGDGLLWLRE